jgi:putative CocE/NonD family hydrolase
LNFNYFTSQVSARGSGAANAIASGMYDDYDAYLSAGSAGDFAKKYGLTQIPWVQKLFEHPAYDAFWQNQALDRLLAAKTMTVPTMTVVGTWDQEDNYGPYASYAVMEAQDKNNDRNFLVIGPWRHSGAKQEGASLGPLKFNGDTALQWRRDRLQPFLDQYLKEGAPDAKTPPVWSYEAGLNRWESLPAWPAATASRTLYLAENFQLRFEPPAATKQPAGDEYVSDPAKPVPFLPRPIHTADSTVWRPWLVSDQRHVASRTDVLSYVTPPLTQAVHLAGAPQVKLFAGTTGTDADWVVKVIDVYPDEVAAQPEMGGYQLAISLDIFRGRYRNSLETPSAIPADVPQAYKFALPPANHRFLPGHRIMVQIQSSLFPVYDRNPQSFVPNIFFARPEDYRKATMTVLRSGAEASAIELPVMAD